MNYDINFFIGLTLSLVWTAIIFVMTKRRVKFSIRVLSSLVVGLILGIYFKNISLYVGILGTLYISFIKMLVIPLVMTLIIVNLTSIDGKHIKSIAIRSIAWLLGTTFLASLIGLFLGKLFDIGKGFTLVSNETFKAREIPNFTKIISDMLPSNPFASMSEGKLIPVIIFSIFIAIAINIESSKNPELIKPVKDFFGGFQKIMYRGIKIVLKLTPYGVFGLILSSSSKYGLSALLPLLKFIGLIYLACFIQIFLVQSSLILFIVKINPIRFLKKISKALVVAFTTCSSYGTLPVTIECLTDEVKISENVASFTSSLGSTMGMNACGGLYPVITSIFVANAFNINLTPSDLILLVFVTTLSSIGTAGVPGTSSIMATIVLTSLGLPLEGLGMLLGIDALIDMIRTATNVSGAATSALLTSNSLKLFDKKAFNNLSLDNNL